MKNSPYLLLEIRYNTWSDYGNVFLVYANRANTIHPELGYASFQDRKCEDTEMFVYPQNETLIKPLSELLKRRCPWEPSMEDFQDRQFRFTEGLKTVHIFKGLVPITEKCYMKARPHDISFDNVSFNDLSDEDYWEFYYDRIETPYGRMKIMDSMRVTQGRQIGVQLDVEASMALPLLPGNPLVNCIDFVVFACKFQKTQIGTYISEDTHKPIKKLVFTDDNDQRTMAFFSSNLGEMSPQEVAAHKNELQIVCINQEEYFLCKQNEMPTKTDVYNRNIDVRFVALMKEPGNIWLFIHLFDKDEKHIASFSATEEELLDTNFGEYLELFGSSES